MTKRNGSSVLTKVEKRKAPFERRFRVRLSDLIETQRDRWNNGYLRDGVVDWDVAFHLFPEDHQTRWLFRELNLDERDPFHWRAILEAFAQTYVLKRGAPRKIDEMILLARDMDRVRTEKLRGVWKASAAVRHLKSNAPYRSKYQTCKHGALLKRVERIAKQIGPMDDEAIDRFHDIHFDPPSRNPFIETIEELDAAYEDDGQGASP